MEKNSSSVVIIEQALESKLTQRRSLMASVEDILIATTARVVEEEHLEVDLLADVEVIEMSNVSIATNMDIMH